MRPNSSDDNLAQVEIWLPDSSYVQSPSSSVDFTGDPIGCQTPIQSGNPVILGDPIMTQGTVPLPGGKSRCPTPATTLPLPSCTSSKAWFCRLRLIHHQSCSRRTFRVQLGRNLSVRHRHHHHLQPSALLRWRPLQCLRLCLRDRWISATWLGSIIEHWPICTSLKRSSRNRLRSNRLCSRVNGGAPCKKNGMNFAGIVPGH